MNTDPKGHTVNTSTGIEWRRDGNVATLCYEGVAQQVTVTLTWYVSNDGRERYLPRWQVRAAGVYEVWYTEDSARQRAYELWADKMA